MEYFLDHFMMENHQKSTLMELEQLENQQKVPKTQPKDAKKPRKKKRKKRKRRFGKPKKRKKQPKVDPVINQSTKKPVDSIQNLAKILKNTSDSVQDLQMAQKSEKTEFLQQNFNKVEAQAFCDKNTLLPFLDMGYLQLDGEESSDGDEFCLQRDWGVVSESPKSNFWNFENFTKIKRQNLQTRRKNTNNTHSRQTTTSSNKTSNHSQHPPSAKIKNSSTKMAIEIEAPNITKKSKNYGQSFTNPNIAQSIAQNMSKNTAYMFLDVTSPKKGYFGLGGQLRPFQELNSNMEKSKESGVAGVVEDLRKTDKAIKKRAGRRRRKTSKKFEQSKVRKLSKKLDEQQV